MSTVLVPVNEYCTVRELAKESKSVIAMPEGYNKSQLMRCEVLQVSPFGLRALAGPTSREAHQFTTGAVVLCDRGSAIKTDDDEVLLVRMDAVVAVEVEVEG